MRTKWEAKEAYVEKKMAENARIQTLTEEQHDALATLCAIRHKIHSCGDSMFNYETSVFSELWDYVDPYGYSDHRSIYNLLSEVGLPTIDFSFAADCPFKEDYYILTEEEREEWEAKADAYNETKPEYAFYHCGYTLWMEESWEYKEYLDTIERINETIEEYLAEIDKKHGTEYCPTGFARLYDSSFSPQKELAGRSGASALSYSKESERDK